MNRLGIWLSRSCIIRSMGETALLGFALMLPLAIAFLGASEYLRSPVLTLGAIEIGLVCGLGGGLRLPLAAKAWRHALLRELTSGLAIAAGVGVAVTMAGLVGVAGVRRLEGSSDPLARFVIPLVFGVTATVANIVAYALCRGIRRAWLGWNRLRRRQLRWALAHSLLVVSLVVAAIGGALLTAADFGVRGSFLTEEMAEDAAGFEAAGLRPGHLLLGLVVTRLVPSALALFLISLIVGVVIVPPVAAISFPVVGRATRRLEELANAAAALRAGNLAARSPVSGEDEIARLQADFNDMAADLQRAQEQLRAERDAVATLLDDRRQLIAAVSHELRTPLATVRGYLDSAVAHWGDEPPATLRHDLQIMRGETDRLDRLIDDLFTLSRAEIGRLSLVVEPTDVGPLLQRVAEAAAPLAWERGRVEVLARVPGVLPPALVDPARIEQAVRNLVTNAVRHTPPGGLVLLTAEAANGEIVVRVKDTGEGIAEADLPHVWDRFFRGTRDGVSQTDRDREGTGLGLALVKELTEVMGGSVAVESALGEGSCFTLRLPKAE